MLGGLRALRQSVSRKVVGAAAGEHIEAGGGKVDRNSEAAKHHHLGQLVELAQLLAAAK